jgi:tRNA A-37 threonylcarbamoyl transferase component Bud32
MTIFGLMTKKKEGKKEKEREKKGKKGGLLSFAFFRFVRELGVLRGGESTHVSTERTFVSHCQAHLLGRGHATHKSAPPKRRGSMAAAEREGGMPQKDTTEKDEVAEEPRARRKKRPAEADGGTGDDAPDGEAPPGKRLRSDSRGSSVDIRVSPSPRSPSPSAEGDSEPSETETETKTTVCSLGLSYAPSSPARRRNNDAPAAESETDVDDYVRVWRGDFKCARGPGLHNIDLFVPGPCARNLRPEIMRLTSADPPTPDSVAPTLAAFPEDQHLRGACLATMQHLDHFKRFVQTWFIVKGGDDEASQWLGRIGSSLMQARSAVVIELPVNTLYLFALPPAVPDDPVESMAMMVYPKLKVNLRAPPSPASNPTAPNSANAAPEQGGGGGAHASSPEQAPSGGSLGTRCPPRDPPARFLSRRPENDPADTSSDAYALSRKYFTDNSLAAGDFIVDGFFDPGSAVFDSLKSLRAQELSARSSSREVILVDQTQDEHLEMLVRKAQSALDSFVDQTSQARVLASFVSVSLGGDAVQVAAVTQHVKDIQNVLGTTVVPLGMLRIGLCRHRSILFKYLCDRFAIPCELRRGSVHGPSSGSALRHSWNVVTFGPDGFVVDVTMEPLSLIPLGSQEAMKYIEEGTRPQRAHVVSVRPDLSERSVVTVPDLRERALLHERIGVGSTSEVFRATVGGVSCAIKVKRLSDLSEEGIRSCEREAQTMEQARHENIVRYLGHEVFPERHEFHIMMELFPMSLAQLITKRKEIGHRSLALSEMKFLAIQVLGGIDYLHQKDLVHCDLKSDNILVDFDIHGEFNRVKLSDLGASRPASENGPPRQGTDLYMAPESLNDGVYTSASDIWSFGLLLVEMVGLARPYAELSKEAAIARIRQGQAPNFPHPGCGVQARILDAARSCLSVDPQGRPVAERLLVDFYRIQCAS